MKSGTERKIPYGFPYMWNIKKIKQSNKTKQNRFRETETKRMVTRAWVGGWVEKVKGNVFINILVSLYGNR